MRFEYRGRWWFVTSGVCIVNGACTATIPVVISCDGTVVLRINSLDKRDVHLAIDEHVDGIEETHWQNVLRKGR